MSSKGRLSRVVLMFASMLFAYFTVTLKCAWQYHRDNHHVLHFAAFGTFVGFLGIIAGLTRHHCAAKVYGFGLFLLMLQAAHGLHAHLPMQRSQCVGDATKVMHVITVNVIDFGFFRTAAVHDDPQAFVNRKELHACNQHVLHMYVLSMASVLLVGCSLMWCSLRLGEKAMSRRYHRVATEGEEHGAADNNTDADFADEAGEDDLKKPLVEVFTIQRDSKFV